MVWPAFQNHQPSFATGQSDPGCCHVRRTLLERVGQGVNQCLFWTQGLTQQRCRFQSLQALRMILGQLQQHRFSTLLLLSVTSQQRASNGQCRLRCQRCSLQAELS